MHACQVSSEIQSITIASAHYSKKFPTTHVCVNLDLYEKVMVDLVFVHQMNILWMANVSVMMDLYGKLAV